MELNSCRRKGEQESYTRQNKQTKKTGLWQGFFSSGDDGRVYRRVTSLELMERFLIDWFEIPFLGEPNL